MISERRKKSKYYYKGGEKQVKERLFQVILLAFLFGFGLAGVIWAFEDPLSPEELQEAEKIAKEKIDSFLEDYFGAPQEPWWKDEKIIKELNLSQDQVERISEINLDSRKEGIRLRSELKIKEMELNELFDQERPDEAKIRAKAKEISDLKEKIFWNEMNLRLSLRKILSLDQERQVRNMMGKRPYRLHCKFPKP